MSLVTPFDPWKSALCSCPQKLSLSPYTGCQHGCLYCYASSYIVNFHSIRPKKNYLNRLEKEITRIPAGSLITLSNSSDPYTPLEKTLELTRATLRLLRNRDIKIIVVTKSDLILRDLDIIKDLKNITVSMTVTTLKKDLSIKLEPLAPLPSRRLKAIEELSRYVSVACRLDPLIYPLTTPEIKEIVKELKKTGVTQIITSTYKAKSGNFKRMNETFPEYGELWQKLYLKQGEKKHNCLYLPARLREKLIEEVRIATLKENLEFSSCREGFGRLNTKNCDGSSLFKPLFL